MIDLSWYANNFQIGLGVSIIALFVVLYFFAKFPEKKSTRK